jgi:hypothetical protein
MVPTRRSAGHRLIVCAAIRCPKDVRRRTPNCCPLRAPRASHQKTGALDVSSAAAEWAGRTGAGRTPLRAPDWAGPDPLVSAGPAGEPPGPSPRRIRHPPSPTRRPVPPGRVGSLRPGRWGWPQERRSAALGGGGAGSPALAGRHWSTRGPARSRGANPDGAGGEDRDRLVPARQPPGPKRRRGRRSSAAPGRTRTARPPAGRRAPMAECLKPVCASLPACWQAPAAPTSRRRLRPRAAQT